MGISPGSGLLRQYRATCPYLLLATMTISNDAFRRFQEELAALEAAQEQRKSPADRLAEARTAFLALRNRYQLTVADVITFFPEEEGIAYLQGLLAAADAPAPKRRKRSTEPKP